MAVCYNNLWKLLIDRNMNKTELKEAAGISFNVIARMGKGEPVSFESMKKICTALQCNTGDIMAFSEEPPCCDNASLIRAGKAPAYNRSCLC